MLPPIVQGFPESMDSRFRGNDVGGASATPTDDGMVGMGGSSLIAGAGSATTHTNA